MGERDDDVSVFDLPKTPLRVARIFLVMGAVIGGMAIYVRPWGLALAFALTSLPLSWLMVMGRGPERIEVGPEGLTLYWPQPNFSRSDLYECAETTTIEFFVDPENRGFVQLGRRNGTLPTRFQVSSTLFPSPEEFDRFCEAIRRQRGWVVKD